MDTIVLRLFALLIGLFLANSAYAQASLINQQCAAVLPDNTTKSITPANMRTCVGYITSGVGAPSFTYAGMLTTSNSVIVSGTVSATRFVGNGAGLTNLSVTAVVNSVSWSIISGIPAGVANISNSTGSVTATSFAGNISGTNGYFRNVSSTNLTVPGNTLLDGSGLTKIGTGTLYSNGAQSTGNYGIIANGNFTVAPDGTIRHYENVTDAVFTQNMYVGANSTASNGASLEAFGPISGTIYSRLISATMPTGTVSATNVYARNVSATFLTGDGSGITNLPSGGTPQSIVSGSTRVDARQDGTISFTTGGIVTGYFDTAGRLIAPTVSATSLNSLNISTTNLYLNSNTLVAGEQLYVRPNAGGLVVDGAAGFHYSPENDNSIFSSTDLPASILSSATVHVSGTMRVTSWTALGANVTASVPLEVFGTTSATTVTATTLNARVASLTTLTVASCTGCGGGGGGSSISTTTFTAATNISGSTAIGFNTGNLAFTGVSNTLYGANTGTNFTTANNNVYLGSGVGLLVTTSSQGVAIGSRALTKLNNSTFGGVAIGYQAMQNAVSANRGVFIGNTAGGTATGTIGVDNIAIGNSALGGSNATGAANVVIGSNSGSGLDSGNNNTFVGNNSGIAIATSNFNTALGSLALGNSTASSFTTAIGYNAFPLSGNAATSNVCLGALCGPSVTTGNSNTLIGTGAGSGLTTGSNNIVIGASPTIFSGTGSNQLNIGDAIYGDIGRSQNQKIGINVPSPTVALEVSGTVSASTAVYAPNTWKAYATFSGVAQGASVTASQTLNISSIVDVSIASGSTRCGYQFAIANGVFSNTPMCEAALYNSDGNTNILVNVPNCTTTSCTVAGTTRNNGCIAFPPAVVNLKCMGR